MMINKYRISKEGSEWIVSDRKTGWIIAYFTHKHEASDYLTDQFRADEQSQVLGDFNQQQLMREFSADLF